MRFFLLLFIAIPLVEIWLLIEVGGQIGAFPTVALIVLTAVVGVFLIKLQGLSTLMRAQSRIAAGEMPAQEMAEGMVLALCGVCLLIPGFATDALGFLGLVPPVRRHLIAPWLNRRTHYHQGPRRPGGPGSGRTLEGEYRRDDDQDSLR